MELKTIISELEKVEYDIEGLAYGRSDEALGQAIDYRSTLVKMLEEMKAEDTKSPILKTSADLDFEDLAHWHQRSTGLLGQPVSITLPTK